MSPESSVSRVVTLDQGGNTAQIQLQEDGKPLREAGKAQLGRRYVCGQYITFESDGKTQTTLISGEAKTSGGKVNFGCGTEALCTKAPSAGEDTTGIPSCCDLPMSLQVPKPLPSSD